MKGLIAAARASDTDALVVLYRGEAVVDEWFVAEPGPIEAMSITKSIVSLAVGRLLTAGVIETLDVPIHAFFPEWRQGRKQQITLRNLLQMQSGLQDLPMTGPEINPSLDAVQLALCAELTTDPGTTFAYGNKGVNLLPEIVKRISGRSIDAFLADELFEPMGIRAPQWQTDPAGHHYGMTGLLVWPEDLARLGQLILQRGAWNGQQLLAAAWVEDALRGSDVAPFYGQLWWIDRRTVRVFDDETFLAWKKAGVPKRLRSALEPLRGQRIADERPIEVALANLGGFSTFKTEVAERSGHWGRIVESTFVIRGDGWQGQRLLVFTDLELVVVRMRRAKFGNTPEENADYGFPELETLSRRLIASSPR